MDTEEVYPDDNLEDLTAFMINPLYLDDSLDKQDLEQDDDDDEMGVNDQNNLLDVSMSKDESMHLYNNVV